MLQRGKWHNVCFCVHESFSRRKKDVSFKDELSPSNVPFKKYQIWNQTLHDIEWLRKSVSAKTQSFNVHNWRAEKHTADQPSIFTLFNIWTGLQKWIYLIHQQVLHHIYCSKVTHVSAGHSSMHSSPRELLNILLITHSNG